MRFGPAPASLLSPNLVPNVVSVNWLATRIRSKDHGFAFHRVFRATAPQVSVFETLGAPLVEVRATHEGAATQHLHSPRLNDCICTD